ncbi:MAG: xanthine phosphoribosyltransferase, partial [Anaerolineae bacterium]
TSRRQGLMQALKERILQDGQNLGRGILKVDSFINHQVDAALMLEAGREMAAAFAGVGATKVLTAEISGIAPAMTTALTLGIPLLYARKTKPVTMTDPVYVEAAPSHTKGASVFLMCSPEFLGPGDRILIVDDFLASGQTIGALVRMVRHAGAELVGIGALIEKSFEGGRADLASLDVPLKALVTITSMSDGEITFAE